MGCSTSLPPEHKPSPENNTVTKNHHHISSPTDIHYERILSSPGQLEIPHKFKKWFPPNHGHIRIRDLFKFHKELGNGVTGSVHEIEYKSQLCAVKQIHKNDKWGAMFFETEAQILSNLSHDGIISIIDMFFDTKYYYLVLEKADFDLYYVMRKKGHLPEKKTRNIVYSLLKALRYMHRKNIAHRDLKPENIVFIATDTNNPRLIDFADAELAIKNNKYTEFVGTPPYMSPERLGEHYGWQLKKADIWAIAVIAYEMYCGKRCFVGDTQKQVFTRILRGEWQWPNDRKPTHQFKDFMNQCLQNDAKDRPSAQEALNHPWFETNRNDDNNNDDNGLKLIDNGLKLIDNGLKPIDNGLKPIDNKSDVETTDDRLDDHDRKPVKVKDITEITIFSNLANMVQNNPLQNILIRGCIDVMKEDDLTPYKLQFDTLDLDKDGYITGPDLVTTFTNNGISSHEASSLASILLLLLDTNRSGKISFKQFLTARFKCDIANKSRQIFNDIMTMSMCNMDAFDSECDDDDVCLSVSPQPAWKQREREREREKGRKKKGILQRDIIVYSKSQSNLSVNRDELRELFCKYDKDGDGQLTYNEFAKAVQMTTVAETEVPGASLSSIYRRWNSL